VAASASAVPARDSVVSVSTRLLRLMSCELRLLICELIPTMSVVVAIPRLASELVARLPALSEVTS
jgi:hypothetical protein